PSAGARQSRQDGVTAEREQRVSAGETVRRRRRQTEKGLGPRAMEMLLEQIVQSFRAAETDYDQQRFGAAAVEEQNQRGAAGKSNQGALRSQRRDRLEQF